MIDPVRMPLELPPAVTPGGRAPEVGTDGLAVASFATLLESKPWAGRTVPCANVHDDLAMGSIATVTLAIAPIDEDGSGIAVTLAAISAPSMARACPDDTIDAPTAPADAVAAATIDDAPPGLASDQRADRHVTDAAPVKTSLESLRESRIVDAPAKARSTALIFNEHGLLGRSIALKALNAEKGRATTDAVAPPLSSGVRATIGWTPGFALPAEASPPAHSPEHLKQRFAEIPGDRGQAIPGTQAGPGLAAAVRSALRTTDGESLRSSAPRARQVQSQSAARDRPSPVALSVASDDQALRVIASVEQLAYADKLRLRDRVAAMLSQRGITIRDVTVAGVTLSDGSQQGE